MNIYGSIFVSRKYLTPTFIILEVFVPKKRVEIARDISWKIWLKTTNKGYIRMIEGYNFDKSFIPVYQAHGIFIEAYKNIYEKYVGSINDFNFYRSLFIKFAEEEI